MADWFVRKSGSDAAAGTSAATAWLTIGKALGASGMASGDRVFVGAGVYREVVTVAMTAATATTYVTGDVDGVQTGDAGEVRWTAYTTNDKTAPSSTACLVLSGRHFLSFSNICFIGGTGNPCCVNGGTATHDITFTNCSFVIGHTSNGAISIQSAAGVALNWTIDRCLISGGASSAGVGSIQIGLTRHTSDYNTAVLIRNTRFVVGTSNGIRIQSNGSGTGFGGGVGIVNCFIAYPRDGGVVVNDANLSATYPCTVTNSVIISGQGFYAAAANLCTEDYCVIYAATARTNVSAGAHSISNGSYAPGFSHGSESIWGGALRPFAMPSSGSPWLGFGGSSPPAVDILGAARPAGGASASVAVGAYERGNSFGKETGTVRTGSNALSITGPGYQDFSVPVSAAATTFTIYGRYDSTYAGTLPSLNIINGTECGKANATATMAGAANAWEALTLTFTPTAAGIVTVRLLSSDTNGGGKAFFDDWAVT